MLIIAESLTQLDFDALMDIYVEGYRENGERLWPEKPEEDGMILVKREFHRYLMEQFFTKPGAVYAVWEVDGNYVSALRLEPYWDGLLLEALETRPEERKKGYAVTLIRAVQDWLRKQGGFKVHSHVSEHNTASWRTHERCGFCRFMEHTVWLDGSVNSNAYTMLYEEA